MKKVLKRVLGDPEAKTLKRYNKKVKEINQLEAGVKKLSDTKLKAKTEEFKKRLAKESLDALLPEAFAVVREAAYRVIGQRHFDVQLVGGMTLHEGKVAEMRTGEGKTLVATLPLYLNALTGKGAHLVTVNDYLARIGAGWMGPVYGFLGMSLGVIMPDASFVYDADYDNKEADDPRFAHLRPSTRQEAYAADITYGTNNEFGFDYLRDNMVRDADQLRQRGLHYAIVDEVDSILIDEARTPLIISAPSVTSGNMYQQFSRVVKQLKPEHYEKDEKRRAVVLTDEGVEKVEKILGIKGLYNTENIRTIYHLEQALRAETLFIRDKNYVVTKDGEVVIVDEFTGRLLKGRRYNEGLHQAIEAKEGVEVQEESMTLAKVSFQNLFRLYEKLAGMTGTAKTEEEEFQQIYDLDVVVIPTNKPIVRKDHPDVIYKTEAAKFRAIVKKVSELNKKGQPVLLGTSSIEKNEHLSGLLNKAGIQHQVLNAKNNLSEAKIVAKAGTKGAVTLATNIAGRGTDIVLDADVREKLGGLYVIGTERHESRRIDNQLRGRSGRQGDPGESQFYVSTEDDIMRIFNGERIGSLMGRMKLDEDTPIEMRVLGRALEAAQKKVEGFNFDSRKNVVQYDDVMNRHRLSVYNTRRKLLEDQDVSAKIKEFIESEAVALASLPGQDDDYERQIVHVFPFDEPTLDRLFDAEADKFAQVLTVEALELYAAKEKVFSDNILHEIERDIYFQILDNLWMQHLENMEHMQQGVQWRSVGQRDPLVEYRREAQILFDIMQQNLRHEVVRSLMHAQPIEQAPSQLHETELTRAARGSVENAGQIIDGETLSEADFKATAKKEEVEAHKKANKRKVARKKERQNKKKARRK
ncbi:preprotein translocase subunit SecA [Candidatus Nomurabacteria bacterium]|nr:preprotein translocase subunit SecA [Candidatus Nomurabacteria bacterium]